MMVYFKRLRSSGFVSLEAFKMYYVMRTFAPSLHRKSTDILIHENKPYLNDLCSSARAFVSGDFVTHARNVLLAKKKKYYFHLNVQILY